MRYKLPLTGVALLLSANGWAAAVPYYSIEKIQIKADGANYGAYPSAISNDGFFIGSYSMKASLSKDIDLGLPFTFNRECQYDSVICELEFYGSQTSVNLNYENAYQQWRNAQSNAPYADYSSYFMGNTLLDGVDDAQIPYPASVNNSDVKITDVTDLLAADRFIVGYSSAPYEGGTREFTRRAFIKSKSGGEVTSLLPYFKDKGGFSSAYKLKEVTYAGGSKQTLVIGSASYSYPNKSSDNFNRCFFSNEDDSRTNYNELVYCPGFDTQAWAWDVTATVNGGVADVSGFALADSWLSGYGTAITSSSTALDINSRGIAVGTSTFQYSNNSLGARQRAVIMTPSAAGVYGAPVRISQAEQGIESADDNLYNTWAIGINDADIIIGNREYSAVKGRNKPTEFFVYDLNSGSISFPLLDKKVLSTEQRLAGDSGSKSGANSQAYDINDAGFVVGKADDYDQRDPVYLGSPRSPSAFLYDTGSKQSWFINDLICSSSDGVVTAPLYRIHSATVINNLGEVLAEGVEYPTDQDYLYKTNGTEVAFKLTPVAGMDPNDSPNCWDSELLKSTDTPYQRQGGAAFWLWIFALPVLLIRRSIQ